MKVLHTKTGTILGEKVKLATSFSDRLIGLMFRSEMGEIDGLILDPCNSVHNCFVRFPIDVVFLTSENKIVKIIRNFRPWRFSWIYFSAKRVLELPGGSLGSSISEGDMLEVQGV